MEDQSVGTTFSLVRYNNPVVIDKEESLVRPKSAPASSGTSEAQDETQEILDSILPPREWEEDGKLWRQSVKDKRVIHFVDNERVKGGHGQRFQQARNRSC